MPADIVIIDDHHLFASGIAALLEGLGQVRVFANLSDARPALKVRTPDIVLLDFFIPGTNAEETIAALQSDLNVPRILVLSSSLSPDDREIALRAGARGFLTKHSSPERLLAVIEGVLNDAVPDFGSAAEGVARQVGLTQRQFDVLLLASKGYPNREIARLLGVSGETVKSHMHAVFTRLGVATRTEAVAAARAEGIL